MPNARQILIVDDDPQIRLLVARFLQRHGYQVTGAPDGRAMLENLERIRQTCGQLEAQSQQLATRVQQFKI